jgi:beta-galactosidase
MAGGRNSGMTSSFHFGVDYYPEQWPEARWPEDARLMAEAGFNVVRLAEFAWSKMEPVEGHYDFDWLDRAIATIAAHDMRIVLGTPTASPPPWLMKRHPEIFRVREDGQRVSFGNRREYCPNSPRYHDYTQRIVMRMAEHYARHRHVIGWQIDNEFGDRCYCPTCATAFYAWLRRRYESLEQLNLAWGTLFWSHVYTDWDEIPLPLATGGSPNPGLALDFYRFASDSYVGYQQLQLDILHKSCPNHFVTHNFMGFGYDRLNYFDLARHLDFVSWDNYPRTQWSMRSEIDPSQAALANDAMRGLKRRNFWVIEQQAGSGGWEMVSVAPRPGELRLWAYQAIAHGADGILFFRWRTARFGAEQYWHGLLDHAARPTRRYEEIARMGKEIRQAGTWIRDSVVASHVAMILSYDSRFAFQIQPNNPQFNYAAHFHQIYRALFQHQIPVDVVEPTADLSAYQLVIAPALHVVSQAAADNLAGFVRAGGVLVVTPRTGVKDETNAVVELPLPGLLADLCGVTVEEYASLPADVSQALAFVPPDLDRGQPPAARVWCDILAPKGAEILARYTDDYYAGRPAITLNRYGEGLAVYLGTIGDTGLYEVLADWLLDLAGVSQPIGAPVGVELAERWHGDRQLLFVLNHTDREQHVQVDGCYINLLDGQAVRGNDVAVAAWDVLVLLEDGSPA